MTSVYAASQIDGFMSSEELGWLAGVASRCVTIVEIGALRGRSTKAMAACVQGRVIAIDNWKWKNSRDEFMKNLSLEIAEGRCVPVSGSSTDHGTIAGIADLMGRFGKADMLFVDADHTYESTKKEILVYRKFVAYGGLVAGHDYNAKDHPGVVQAVDEVLGKPMRPAGSIWMVRA